MNRNPIQGISVIAAIAGLSAWGVRRFLPQAPIATEWIIAWTAIESVAAYGGLSWALQKSDTVFYSMFTGGTLFRLASLGVIAGLLIWQGIPLLIPLVALAGFYFLFSVIQLPFLIYGLR